MQKQKLFYKVYPKSPKKDIGRYIKSNTKILVPGIFYSIKDAIESNQTFVIRSETAYEFAGPSGLLDSYLVTRDLIKELEKSADLTMLQDTSFKSVLAFYLLTHRDKFSWDDKESDLWKKLYSIPGTIHKIMEYCKYAHLDIKTFKDSISYSYWKFIPGINGAIIADTAIKNRYHIKIADGHIIIENKQCIAEFTFRMQKEVSILKNNSSRLIEFYNTIRYLPAFGKKECPLIEFQLDKKQNIHFLQYHITRKLHTAKDFQIPDVPEDADKAFKAFKALLVRGCTGKKGEIFEINLHDPVLSENTGEFYFKGFPNNNIMYIEAVCRLRKIVLIHYDGTSYFPDHTNRSLLFKPEMSLIIDISKLLTEERLKAIGNYKNPCIKVKVVSNGREAYFQVISEIYSKADNAGAHSANIKKSNKPGKTGIFKKKQAESKADNKEFKAFFKEVQQVLALEQNDSPLTALQELLIKGNSVSWYAGEDLYYAVLTRLLTYTLPVSKEKALNYLNEFLFSGLARHYSSTCLAIADDIYKSLNARNVERIKALPYKIKALYVDDDKFNLSLYSKHLKEFGIDVSTANNANDALESIQSNYTNGQPFHVVISDYLLRGCMDGVSLLRKAAEIDNGILCILLTEYAYFRMQKQPDDYYKKIHILDEGSKEGISAIIIQHIDNEKR